MKNLLSAFLFFSISLCAQSEYKWETLPESPAAGRHDDIHFLTPDLGWAVNSSGEIWKTENGGETWLLQYQTGSYLRCIKFSDSLNGWAGSLTESAPLYFTVNGGFDWNPVVNLPSPKPRRICGLYVIGEVIYGSGAYDGPAVIIKSTDKGVTWTSIDMRLHASSLVDCYFTSPDSGFVVGGSPDGILYPPNGKLKAVVLRTLDGGLSWENEYTGNISDEWGWKIVFPSKNVGYVSVENFYSAGILKTTNGGLNWSKLPVTGLADLEGIGFINDSTGWVAARNQEAFTNDGGKNWTIKDVNIGEQINRFQFFGDTLAYAAGQQIYRYKKSTPTNVIKSPGEFNSFLLSQNYPNPFNPSTTIEYTLPEPSNVKVRIFDGLGKELFTLYNSYQQSGRHSVQWDGTDSNGNLLASGFYIYRIDTDKYSESRMMLMLK